MERSDFLIKLGANISAKRKQKGLTLQELSWKCDFEKSNLARIEKGRTNPTVITLNRIANALNIPTCDLIDFEKSEFAQNSPAPLSVRA